MVHASPAEQAGLSRSFIRNRDKVFRLRELAGLFLKLGVIGFGGPAAHIAMMEQEVVRRRGWLTHKEFLDLLGATNLIPGPNSTEMAIHIGHRRAGGWGLVVAGVCFIVPAVLIVLVCAWGYTRYGHLPRAEAVLNGVKPVMIGIVIRALWVLGKAALKTPALGAVAASAIVLALAGVNELLILLLAGIVMVGAHRLPPFESASPALLALPKTNGIYAAIFRAGVGSTVAAPFAFGTLFLTFLKIGSVLYGSGYVLLAFLRSDLVERLHWLTEAQLLDAIAIGQVTPGPVFTTATFIGYVLGGTSGALLATAGIFLPAFVFVAISGPLVPRIRRSAAASALLDGVNAASLALMFAVTLELGRVALPDWYAVLIAISATILEFRRTVNSAWLVGAGALLGLLRAYFPAM